MSFWSAVVIIVAIIAITNLRMAKYRARGLHGAHPGRFIDAGPIGRPRANSNSSARSKACGNA